MKKLLYSSVVLLLFSFLVILFLLSNCKKDNDIPLPPTPLENVTASPFTVKYDISFSEELLSDGSYKIQYSPPDYPADNSNVKIDYVSKPAKGWNKSIIVSTQKRPLDIFLGCFVRFYKAGTITMSISINGTVIQTSVFDKPINNGDGVAMSVRIN